VSDDYLWDRSGEPDPEVERLERLLEPLRGRRPAPEFPAARRRAFGGWVSMAAAAASLVLAISATWRASRGRDTSWEVSWLGASAGEVVAGAGRLRVGEWLDTGEASRARITVGRIGEMDVEPRTRLRLLDAGAQSHRLALARGIVHARIWAPPGQFLVDTPSAVAVDLGCAYTLEVDDGGAGLLRVSSGWVGFEHRGRESFVPQGAVCAMRPVVGPGTPYYDDGPEELRRALAVLDFGDADARGPALRQALAAARVRDALSLWHLLGRVDRGERGLVYDRLAELVPPPAGVTRDGILAGSREMRDLWWDALDIGSVRWWRVWKAPWPATWDAITPFPNAASPSLAGASPAGR
jgi:hypothetical protein